MAFKYFLIFIALIPSAFNQCTVEKAQPFFQRSVYEFSLELIARISGETENHFVTSAFSPWILLSALSLGATDGTLNEFNQVLRMHPHKCFNNKFFEIVKDITATNDGVTLERSSTFFVDESLQLKTSFKTKLQNTRVSDIETLSFQNFIDVADKINDYVSRATHGNIDEIVSPNDLEDVYVIAIDALYFKGTWKNKFRTDETEISAFYDEFKRQIGDVNLMFSEQHVNVTSVPQIQAQVLELPYGSDSRFSMLFFLPDSGVPLAIVIEKLKSINMNTIFTLFRLYGPSLTSVQIPKFEIQSELDNMKEWLTDMGLRSMFDSHLARFPEISDYSLYISNFIQKANIEVSEEGSEASVSSAAFLEARSFPVVVNQFVANRPFLFMIVDRKTEIPLFTGGYSRPSIY